MIEASQKSNVFVKPYNIEDANSLVTFSIFRTLVIMEKECNCRYF